MQGTKLDGFLKYLSTLQKMIVWVLEKEKEKERETERQGEGEEGRKRGKEGREERERETKREGEEGRKDQNGLVW